MGRVAAPVAATPVVVRIDTNPPRSHGGGTAQGFAFLGAVGAQALFGSPENEFAAQLVHTFTNVNLFIIALNLIPVPPLDGAEAWKLPWLVLRRPRRRRQVARSTSIRSAVERELARLDADDRKPASPEITAAVDAVLKKISE